MTVPADASPRDGFVDADGPIHLLDWGGPDSGPLLVGLHGLGGSHLNWSAVAPQLCTSARFVAIDMVGHGLTLLAGRRADISGHRQLVSRFLRAIGGGPAILVGNSMGGLVAALQAVDEPESVAGLVLIDPALPTSRLGMVHPRVAANFLLCAVPGVGESFLSQRRKRTSAEHTVHRVLDACCVDAARVPADVVEAHIRLTEQLDGAQFDAAYLASARSLSGLLARPAGTMQLLEHLHHPVLLLHGACDRLVPLSSARRMSAAHPDWRFEVAAGIGHVPMLEAPQWTSAAIIDWLGRRGALHGGVDPDAGHEPVPAAD